VDDILILPGAAGVEPLRLSVAQSLSLEAENKITTNKVDDTCMVSTGRPTILSELTYFCIGKFADDIKARFPLPELTARVNGPS